MFRNFRNTSSRREWRQVSEKGKGNDGELGMRNRERGTGTVNREWRMWSEEMGNEEQGTRNVKNVEQGTGTRNGERVKRYGE